MAARERTPQARQGGRSLAPANNDGDARERMMYRHMTLIHVIASELSPEKSSVPAPSLHRPTRFKRQVRNER